MKISSNTSAKRPIVWKKKKYMADCLTLGSDIIVLCFRRHCFQVRHSKIRMKEWPIIPLFIKCMTVQLNLAHIINSLCLISMQHFDLSIIFSSEFLQNETKETKCILSSFLWLTQTYICYLFVRHAILMLQSNLISVYFIECLLSYFII